LATKTRTVQQGECLLSLAYEEGLPWDRIWNDPANRELKDKRKQPGILCPGDSVSIPEPRPRQEKGNTEEKHRFRMRSKVELRVHVHEIDGAPRADLPYYVEIDGRKYRGLTKKTDKDGLCVAHVPANAVRGSLVVGEQEDVYDLWIGYLDPAVTVTGLHARLENVGFTAGGVETPYDEQSFVAMSQFLHAVGKNPSETDPANPEDEKSRTALQDWYGA